MNPFSFLNSPFWEKNREALARRDAKLAYTLSKTEIPPNRFVPMRSRDGWPALSIRLNSGESVPLCSIESPVGEAERWVLGLGETLYRNAHVLLLGFSAGYHPMAFFRQMDQDSVLWIVEPDPVLFKAALHLLDFSALFASDRVHFAVGQTPRETVRLLFTVHGGHRMRAQGIQVAFNKASRFLYADYIQNLGAAIQESIQIEGLKFKTSEMQGKIILDNILRNLPFLLQGAPWKRLQSQAAGIPALIIAPGPSLEEALPWIDTCRENALLIAIDTAYRILHQHGLPADLVASLDFTELNVRHFETIHEDSAILLAYPGVQPAICERYAGRTFFYDHAGNLEYQSGASPFLKTIRTLPALGDLISYGSTAHIAAHAARMMGCNPILLVGHDLAFPRARWYAAGAMQNELDQPEREQETLLQVPSNDGQTVSTSGLYQYYRNTFSELIQGTASPVINTSPHGARIESCRWMAVQEAIKIFCREPVEKSFLRIHLRSPLTVNRHDLAKELAGFEDRCHGVRRKVRRLRERLNSQSLASSTFREEMILWLKSFAQLLREETAMINLAASLCSRGTLAILGQINPAAFFRDGNSPVSASQFHQYETLLDDFHEALNWMADRFQATGKYVL